MLRAAPPSPLAAPASIEAIGFSHRSAAALAIERERGVSAGWRVRKERGRETTRRAIRTAREVYGASPRPLLVGREREKTDSRESRVSRHSEPAPSSLDEGLPRGHA